jgi:hypothetical protein
MEGARTGSVSLSPIPEILAPVRILHRDKVDTFLARGGAAHLTHPVSVRAEFDSVRRYIIEISANAIWAADSLLHAAGRSGWPEIPA